MTHWHRERQVFVRKRIIRFRELVQTRVLTRVPNCNCVNYYGIGFVQLEIRALKIVSLIGNENITIQSRLVFVFYDSIKNVNI